MRNGGNFGIYIRLEEMTFNRSIIILIDFSMWSSNFNALNGMIIYRCLTWNKEEEKWGFNWCFHYLHSNFHFRFFRIARLYYWNKVSPPKFLENQSHVCYLFLAHHHITISNTRQSISKFILKSPEWHCWKQ